MSECSPLGGDGRWPYSQSACGDHGACVLNSQFGTNATEAVERWNTMSIANPSARLPPLYMCQCDSGWSSHDAYCHQNIHVLFALWWIAVGLVCFIWSHFVKALVIYRRMRRQNRASNAQRVADDASVLKSKLNTTQVSRATYTEPKVTTQSVWKKVKSAIVTLASNPTQRTLFMCAMHLFGFSCLIITKLITLGRNLDSKHPEHMDLIGIDVWSTTFYILTCVTYLMAGHCSSGIWLVSAIAFYSRADALKLKKAFNRDLAMVIFFDCVSYSLVVVSAFVAAFGDDTSYSPSQYGALDLLVMAHFVLKGFAPRCVLQPDMRVSSIVIENMHKHHQRTAQIVAKKAEQISEQKLRTASMEFGGSEKRVVDLSKALAKSTAATTQDVYLASASSPSNKFLHLGVRSSDDLPSSPVVSPSHHHANGGDDVLTRFPSPALDGEGEEMDVDEHGDDSNEHTHGGGRTRQPISSTLAVTTTAGGGSFTIMATSEIGRENGQASLSPTNGARPPRIPAVRGACLAPPSSAVSANAPKAPASKVTSQEAIQAEQQEQLATFVTRLGKHTRHALVMAYVYIVLMGSFAFLPYLRPTVGYLIPVSLTFAVATIRTLLATLMPQGTKTKEVMEKPESTKKESTKKDSTKRDVTSGIRMQPVRSKTNTQAASSQLSNPPLAQQEVHPPGMVLSGEERLLPTQFIVHPPSPRGDRLDSPRGGAPGGNDDQEDGDFAAHDAGEKDWKDSDEPELRVTLHVPETNLTPEEEMNNFSHDLPLSPSPPPERRRGVHPSVPPLRTSAW